MAETAPSQGWPKTLKRGADRRAFLTDPSHKHVFHFTPKHGSWLNQVELWFGVLQRRFLARGDFKSAEAFVRRLTAYLEDDNAHYAHPYRWTYTGQPLVRATPFDGPDDSNNTVELGSTADRNDLKNCSTHRDPIAPPLNFIETYEMNI